MMWAREGKTLWSRTLWTSVSGSATPSDRNVELVVEVGRADDGGQDDAAGTDAGDDQSGDAALAQPLVEVGGGHAAVADLAHGDVAVLGSQALVDGGGGVLVVHDAVLGQRGEALVGRPGSRPSQPR